MNHAETPPAAAAAAAGAPAEPRTAQAKASKKPRPPRPPKDRSPTSTMAHPDPSASTASSASAPATMAPSASPAAAAAVSADGTSPKGKSRYAAKRAKAAAAKAAALSLDAAPFVPRNPAAAAGAPGGPPTASPPKAPRRNRSRDSPAPDATAGSSSSSPANGQIPPTVSRTNAKGKGKAKPPKPTPPVNPQRAYVAAEVDVPRAPYHHPRGGKVRGFQAGLTDAGDASHPKVPSPPRNGAASGAAAAGPKAARVSAPPALALVDEHSFAPLARSLATELIRGTKECVICMDEIRRHHKLWSCTVCFAPHHLHCVREWTDTSSAAASNANSTENLTIITNSAITVRTTVRASAVPVPTPTATASASTDAPETQTLRCPSCNTMQPAESARVYTCFCAKTVNPEPNRFLIPHSCGARCDKPLGCVAGDAHTCPLPCHPGPCSPCSAITAVPCPGGHTTRQVVCGSDAATAPIPCDRVCDAPLACGNHRCEATCHAGEHPECPVTVEVACRCGHASRTVACGQESTTWTCTTTCSATFSCGNDHVCEAVCCPLAPADHVQCPLDPAFTDYCPCGKTKLHRASCADPARTPCNSVCGQTMACGHACQMRCHDGPCRCSVEVEVTCECTAETQVRTCSGGDAAAAPFRCETVCNGAFLCRRGHRCKRTCCPASRTAIETLRAALTGGNDGGGSSGGRRRRQQNGGGRNNHYDVAAGLRQQLEAAHHQCDRACGRTLTCGAHECPFPCHAGNCNSCIEASAEPLACHCGRTVIPAPVPCGTTHAACSSPCVRERECGHPVVSYHACHPDWEPCPPCVVLVSRTCQCGKMQVTVWCSQRTTPACGERCGLDLPCGHRCSLGCHAPLFTDPEAEDGSDGSATAPAASTATSTPCQCRENCGKRRARTCGHVCSLPCHFGTACDDMGACSAKVTRTCPCGRQSVTATCTLNGNTVPLECDDRCRLVQRNRQIAEALRIAPRDADELATAARNAYPAEVLEYYRAHPTAAREIEAIMSNLVEELGFLPLAAASSSSSASSSSAASDAAVYRFPPMKAPARSFVHALATVWGIDAVSVDPEPKRNVVLTAHRRTARAPVVSLAAAAARVAADGSPIPSSADPAVAAALAARRTPKPSAAYNALRVVRTPLARKDLEPYLRLYFGATPFAVVHHGPATTLDGVFAATGMAPAPLDTLPGAPQLFDAVVQVDPSARMGPPAVQSFLHDVRGPLHSLLSDLGKAAAVRECWIDQHGRIAREAGFTVVQRRRPVVAASSSDGESGSSSDGEDSSSAASAAATEIRRVVSPVLVAEKPAGPSFVSNNAFAGLAELMDAAGDRDAASDDGKEVVADWTTLM
ncbi:FKBP12-associated protein [Blastocladiella emersonii ATCC 22665]|nr:FKBP12-associated protein [Blastocladiella emersonii ATCC 22665]